MRKYTVQAIIVSLFYCKIRSVSADFSPHNFLGYMFISTRVTIPDTLDSHNDKYFMVWSRIMSYSIFSGDVYARNMLCTFLIMS